MIRFLLLVGCLAAIFGGAAPRAAAADVGFAWAQSYGTASQSTSTPFTAVDASGNIYLTGVFTGTTLTLGATTLTRLGTADVFVAKLASNGRVIWATNFGGSGATLTADRVAVDATGSPNVYVSASFSGANLATPTLTKIGERDILVVKLDSTGAITWSKNFGGAGASALAAGIGIDTASPSNVYVGGSFSGAALTTPALTKIGDSDALAIKLNSSGTTVWATNFGGGNTYTFANDIAVDRAASPNIYLVGGFHYFVSGQPAARPTTPSLTRIGEIDGFMFKLDSSGSIAWSKNYGGAGAYTSLSRVVVDRETSANVYTTGYVHTANLTTPPVTRLGTADGILFKTDSTGVTNWAKSIGGTGASTSVLGVAVDTASPANIYVAGSFGSANLSFPSLTRVGTNDAFVAKFDLTGASLWTKSIAGASAYNLAGSVAVDGSRPTNVILAGEFLSGNLTSPALTKAGSSDVALVKMSSPESGWWWNSSEGGRGYSIEIDNGRLFFAAYGYGTGGVNTWYTSTGSMASDTTYTGTLEAYRDGQTLTGSYQAPVSLGSVGNISLSFTTSQTGTLTLPNGTVVAISRFEITSGGVARGPAASHPHKGWWWNSNEAGRGFFMEVQDSTLFLSGFLYNSAGLATWYVANATMTASNVFIGVFSEYSGGTSFSSTGAFSGPTASVTRGLVTIQFSTQTSAIMTLSTGAQVTLTRFAF